MELGKKIKAIRIEEGLTQSEMAQVIDIPLISYRNYEYEKSTINEKNLIKITKNPQLFKYTLWLMTDQVAPESGQICPAFSIQERCGLTVQHAKKQA